MQLTIKTCGRLNGFFNDIMENGFLNGRLLSIQMAWILKNSRHQCDTSGNLASGCPVLSTGNIECNWSNHAYDTPPFCSWFCFRFHPPMPEWCLGLSVCVRASCICSTVYAYVYDVSFSIAKVVPLLHFCVLPFNVRFCSNSIELPWLMHKTFVVCALLAVSIL